MARRFESSGRGPAENDELREEKNDDVDDVMIGTDVQCRTAQEYRERR